MKPALSVEAATGILTAPGSRFEMEEREIRGVRTRVWKGAPASLRDILEGSRSFGDRTYLVYEEQRLSYAEHYRAVAALARALKQDFALGKGDRVAIAMRNYPEWIVAFWATVCIGAVAVPLNAWWTGGELAYGLSDSGARVLIADEERIRRLATVAADLPLDAVIAVRAAGDPPMAAYRMEDVLASAPAGAGLPEVTIAPEDDATIFYTSGTTGEPKGALGTHRNICTNPISVAFARARTDLRHGRTPAAADAGAAPKGALLSVPLFHVTGCHSTLISNTLAGNKLVLMRKWDPEHALALIESERISAFGGVPAMVWQVLESPAFAAADTSSVETVGYGGAPSAPELVRRVREAFPQAQPRNGYGLTETSSVVSMNIAEDYVAMPESIGPAVAVCDVKVAGEGGEEGPAGEVGELWIRGPNVIKGYWNRPEATAETIPGGWLRSGDIGRRDKEGFLTIVDRTKDMVIRGGENVYCAEVEDALYSHPAVMDAAVIGLPHRVLGEEVGAVVQMTPAGAAVSEGELMAHVAVRLAAFKVPVRIDMRHQPLPRNANGKILKQRLKEELGV